MPTLFANADAGVIWPLTVSKAAGTTLYFTTELNGAPQDLHADVWNLKILNAAGSAVVTLASGSGLTLSGSLITAALTSSSLSSLSPGGFSWELVDTTTSRTRISGNFVLTA